MLLYHSFILLAQGHLQIFSIDDVYKKRSIIKIKNTDKLCGPRAIVTALSMKVSENNPTIRTIPFVQNNLPLLQQYKAISSGRKVQTTLANKLCQECNIDATEGIKLTNITTIENKLNVNINVIDTTMSVIYDNAPTDTPLLDWLFLFLHNNHYSVITNIQAFLGYKKYCGECKKFYQQRHKCTNVDNTKKEKHQAPTNEKVCHICQQVFPCYKEFNKHICYISKEDKRRKVSTVSIL